MRFQRLMLRANGDTQDWTDIPVDCMPLVVVRNLDNPIWPSTIYTVIGSTLMFFRRKVTV